MKNFLFGLFLVLLGCTHDSEIDQLEFDCITSDLSLTIQELINADCQGGSLSVLGLGGDGTYAYAIDGGDFQSSGIFADLVVGTHLITVRDGNACIATITGLIDGGFPSIVAVASSSPAGCETANASITITANGGTEPYQYQLNNGSFQSENQFNSLLSGTYSVIIKDSEGCTVQINQKIETTVSLQHDIVPIINTNCAISGCHLNISGLPSFTSNESIISHASSIRSTVSSGSMPPANQQDLTAQQIALIKCWVADGAKNN